MEDKEVVQIEKGLYENMSALIQEVLKSSVTGYWGDVSASAKKFKEKYVSHKKEPVGEISVGPTLESNELPIDAI